METFGVGIVGAGTIGKVHAAVLSRLEGVRLLAVAEPREEVGRQLAEQAGIDWYPSMEELLARQDIDLVTLATPSGMHPDQAVMAARAGKHVVTEKPMAITLEGADRMIRAAREAGVTLSVIFQNRFHRDVLKLKKAIDAGLFGRPVYGNAFLHWYRSQQYYEESGGWRGTWKYDGGGALMNQSIHYIDLLQWMMGDVESVEGFTATLAHTIETEDVGSAAVRFRSGALGTIQGTTAAYTSRPPRIEIVGTEGGATLAGSSITLWEPREDRELLTAEDLERTRHPEEGEEWWLTHAVQFREIFRCLRAGQTPPVSGEDARKSLEIILAIYQSQRTGCAVQLPLETGER